MDTGWTWGFFLAFSWTHQGQGVHMLWATSWCRFLHQKRWDNDQPTNLIGLRDFTKQKRRIYIQRPLTMGCGTWRCTHMHTYVCNIFIAHQYHRFVISNLVITFPALIYFQRDAGPLFQLYLHNLIYIYCWGLLEFLLPNPIKDNFSGWFVGDWLLRKKWPAIMAMFLALAFHAADYFGAFYTLREVPGVNNTPVAMYQPTLLSSTMSVASMVAFTLSLVCVLTRVHSQLLWMTLRTFDPWATWKSEGLFILASSLCYTTVVAVIKGSLEVYTSELRSFKAKKSHSKEASQQEVLQQRSHTAKKSHSKEVSQQRSLTAKKSHSKEVSQQRSLTKKKSHSKEVSQQRSLAAKKSHSKEVSQQRSPTAKKSHNKEVSQQRSLTAKKSHSKEVRQQRSPTTKKSHSKEVRQQRSPKAKKSHSKDDTKRDENNRHQRWASELRMNKMRWDEMRWHWPRWSEMKWDEVRWGQVKMRKDPTLKRDDGGIKSEKVVAAKHGRLGCTL